MKNELIPDYKEIDKIFIVSPLFLRDNLFIEFLSFCKEIYNIIKIKNKGQKLVIICTNEESKVKTEDLFSNNDLTSDNIIEYFVCPVSDIWIRDYFSCGNIKNEKEGLGTIKAIYNPSYNNIPEFDDSAGCLLSKEFFNRYLIFPMKLDGGNVIANKDFVLISEKIYTENYTLNKKLIDSYIKNSIKQKLCVLPVELLDVVGHTDSICRFIDNDSLLLPIYPFDFKVDNRYIIKVKNILHEVLGENLKIYFLPSYLSDEISDDNIFSAKGLYINFFRFEDYIIFPSFEGLEKYEREIFHIIKRNFPNINVIFSPCNQISYWGGCWNCCTNVKYK